MLTLKQIVTKLRELQQDHKQINDFHFGDPFDFGAERSVMYPLMGVQLTPGRIGLRTDQLGLTLYFADLVPEDKFNKLEVLSDQRLIAAGIYAQFRDYLEENDIKLEDDAPLEDIEDVWDEAVFGYRIDFNVTQFFAHNACQEPSSFDPSATDIGDVIIYNIETGATITTVNAGTSYGVLQFSGIQDSGGPYTNSIVDPG